MGWFVCLRLPLEAIDDASFGGVYKPSCSGSLRVFGGLKNSEKLGREWLQGNISTNIHVCERELRIDHATQYLQILVGLSVPLVRNA
jgi:hypothetical protein